MEIIKTAIPEVLIIKPDVFEDERGYFFEAFNREKFKVMGLSVEFVQDNQSLSGKGVLRGLHYQAPPFEQGKLIRVITGAVLDVAVDIRKNSSTYGKHVTMELSGKNKHMCWIPAGFAHGFLSLADNTIFFYKCTQVYHKMSEGVILWNDPDLNIRWNFPNPQVSARDTKAMPFKDFISPF